MTKCLFCAIGDGAVPSSRIYQDAHTFAFLDIKPLQTGHALVIPKDHAAKYDELSPQQVAQVMQTVQKITPAVCQAAGAMDATIAINDGPDAGQEVPHVHVHIVPRHKGDAAGPIHALFADRPAPDADAIADFAQQVRDILES